MIFYNTNQTISTTDEKECQLNRDTVLMLC